MKIVFSRKGFDSSTGGGPSPIVGGRPVTLPIPNRTGPAATRYGELGLGEHVALASRGALGADSLCHHDPMFLADGNCLFGQCGAAQTHLANRGVGVGDLFLFFGLFRAPGERPHHRFFGYLRVVEMVAIATASAERLQALSAHRHPHALGPHGSNDVIYVGPGRTAQNAADTLRLTVPEGPPSLWAVPDWLAEAGLSYHDRADRWLVGGRLRSASRGQEFVADIGDRARPRAWAEDMIATIEGRA